MGSAAAPGARAVRVVKATRATSPYTRLFIMVVHIRLLAAGGPPRSGGTQGQRAAAERKQPDARHKEACAAVARPIARATVDQEASYRLRARPAAVVAVRRSVLRLSFLLAALALALPPASAGPLDDLVETTRPPDLPGPVDPDDMVRWSDGDGAAEVGVGGVG